MSLSLLLALVLLVVGAAVFTQGLARAAQYGSALHSRPHYHGQRLAFSTVGPSLVLLSIYGLIGQELVEMGARSGAPNAVRAVTDVGWDALMREARQLMAGVDALASDPRPEAVLLAQSATAVDRMLLGGVTLAVLGLTSLGYVRGLARVRADYRARDDVERLVRLVLLACSVVAVLTTVGIVASLLFESVRFFSRVPFNEFLFGLQWSPQIALRADQVGGSGAFGAVPLFYGTLMITVIAMLVAAPIGLYSAIYLSEYAGARARAIVKPALEILAGVPTVVYGFFALLTVGPFIRRMAETVGLDAPTQSALAAGLVMGVMIIPFVSSLSDDVINAVPQDLRDASFAVGATKSETVLRVILPAALPGVMGAMLLAVSRAVGETMIVVMAAGRAANMPLSPLESVTTITVQIKELLTGDQEFDSAKTLSAFALGLVLFAITLVMNVIALQIVRRYRERYE